MNFDEIVNCFNVRQRSSDKVQACCPAHADERASLTISRGNKGTVLRCHAGCKTEDILKTVGLTMRDLFDDGKPRQQDEKWRSYVEAREHRKIEAIYTYVFCGNGAPAFTKLRLTGKKMIYGTFENDRFTYGLSGKHRKDMLAVYGDIKAMRRAIEEGRPIFYCEGEKDVQTLQKHGYRASFTCGSVGDWQSSYTDIVKNSDLIILADNDSPGKELAQRILRDTKGAVRSARIVIPTPDIEKGDISDFFESGHTNEEFEKFIRRQKPDVTGKTCGVSIPEVQSLLSYSIIYSSNGEEKSRKVKQTISNVELILDNDRRTAGKIRFNEFSRQTFLFGNVPWESENNCRPWSSFDDSNLFALLQADYEMKDRQNYFDALKNVSMRNRFHPIKDILNSLHWDGQEHIKGLLPNYLGAEDSTYNYEVFKLFMLGAVSRIFEPGCKFDYTVIFRGEQGIGKSTFLRLLALDDAWFNDSLDSLDGDNAAQKLSGSWIIELAELKSLARTAGGVDSVKRFLSATQDKYRAPYERRTDIFLRQSVFAGSTNKTDFLQDETGNRRFLIVEVGANKPTKSIFEPEVMDDIKMAWAQAVHIYKTQHPKLILPESCRQQAEDMQADAMSDDGKIGIIEDYLRDKVKTCVIEVWQKALGENGRPAKWQASEINNIISKIGGWKKIGYPIRFGEYGSQRGYYNVGRNNAVTDECSSDFMNVAESELENLPFT